MTDVKKTGWKLYVIAGIAAAAAAVIAVTAQRKIPETTTLALDSYPVVVNSRALGNYVESLGKSWTRISEEDGVTLYENSSLIFDVDFPETTDVPVYIIARGKSLRSVHPYLTVRIDGRLVEGFYCTSVDWGLYRVIAQVKEGRHLVEVAYINDEFYFPGDRDIDIRSIGIGTAPEEGRQSRRNVVPWTIQPEKMAVQVYGEFKDDVYRLWNNGVLADDVYFGRSGKFPLQIRASGVEGGTASSLTVLLDGKEAGEFDVQPGKWATFALDIDASAGLHRLELRNDSGSRKQASERDLLIGTIALGESLTSDDGGKTIPVLDGDIFIPAADFSFHSGGSPHGDAWALWENGYISTRITCPIASSWRVVVSAKGDLCENRGPRMMVMTDRDQQALYSVGSTSFLKYATTVSLSEGDHDIMLVFDNDKKASGEDRNLYVQGILLSPAE